MSFGNRSARMIGVAAVLFGLGQGIGAASGQAFAGGGLSPEDANRLAAEGKMLLFDIRSVREWRATGLPAPAKAASIHNRNGIKAFVDEIARAAKGDRSRPIAVICAAGVRSARALRILRANGFTDVYDVSAGMSGSALGPGWISRGLPTRPCTAGDGC